METLELTIDAKFVAYEAGNHEHIIAKGDNADKVIKEAQESGIDFIFCFVPQKDVTYTF